MEVLDVEARALPKKTTETDKAAEDSLLGFIRTRPLLATILFCSTLMLASGDLVEIMPATKPLLQDPAFHVFHEVHDVFALGLVLASTYLWGPAIGRALALTFLSIHFPYIYLTFPAEFDEHIVLIVQTAVALGGVYLMKRLNLAVMTAEVAAGTSRHLARHDVLTDLPNRALFHETVRHSMAHTIRTGGAFAVLYLDLDHFKDVNDSLGHEIGDLLLIEVAELLKRTIRDTDTVARLGGDEFAMIAVDLNSGEDAAYLANRLIAAFARPIMIKGHEIHMSPSIGIAPFPLAANSTVEDPLQLLACADMAMYRAKTGGRNSFEFYDEKMSLHAQDRISLVNDLRSAVEKEQLILHYQPQVDLRTGAAIGAEALLRWSHPSRGLIQPMDFIPIAETSGLVVPVGEWVIRTACAQNHAWQQAGLPAMKIAVNLSPVQLKRQSIVSTVENLLEETGLDASWLDIELTENIFMHDINWTASILDQLRRLGLSLSIDDFGTGYSSLIYLKQFHVDTLKIDEAFVRDVNARGESALIAEAVIKLGHSLGIKVLAEGIETEAELNYLRTMGCDLGQGNYFCEPMEIDRFEEFIVANARDKVQRRIAPAIEFY